MEDDPPLSRIEQVRCLNCRVVYLKPSHGGTVRANPGCPECGYLGWVLERAALSPDASRHRSVGDRLRRRTG